MLDFKKMKEKSCAGKHIQNRNYTRKQLAEESFEESSSLDEDEFGNPKNTVKVVEKSESSEESGGNSDESDSSSLERRKLKNGNLKSGRVQTTV